MSTFAQTDENAQPFYLWDTPYQQPEQTEVNTGISLDSIFPMREIQPPMVRRSLFTHTTLPVTHDDLQQRTAAAPAPWIFVALVLLIALMFLYYNRNKFHISALFMAAADHRAMDRLVRAAADHRAMDRLVRGNNLNTTRLVPMGLFVTVTLATSVYLMALTHNGITAWLVLAAVLFTAYILRNLVARLLGNVFDDKDAVSVCITSNYIYHLLLATALAPLLLLQAYLPWGRDIIFYIMAALTALCLIIRLIRSLQLFLTFSKSRSFYLFFYFCTVEAVPLLVLAKWFLIQ